MKRFVSPFIIFAILAVAFAVSSPNAANGQSAGLVSSVLNRMERNRQSLKSLKASLSMEKYNAQLRDKENYSGWVLYVPASGRDASVRIEWQTPQHEILAVSKGEYTLFRPRLNQDARGRPGREVRGTKGNAVPVRAQPIVQDVTEGQKPAQVPFGKPILDGPSGHVVSVGLPRRRLRAAHHRNRRLGGAGQDGVARIVVVSGVSAGK